MKNIIEKIKLAQSPYTFFKDLKNWKAEYLELIKILHPDITKEPGASEAVNKLNNFKSSLENNLIIQDGISEFQFTINSRVISKIEDNSLLMALHKNNEVRLNSYRQGAGDHFSKYVPEQFENFIYETKDFCLPLVYFMKSPISEVHVNWITSRILEFVCRYHELGFCHLNISPENIWIRPKIHGIYVSGFYHSLSIGNRIRTYNINLKSFYPTSMFSTKNAEISIDLELIKRLSLRLLGSLRGNGSDIKTKINSDLFNYYTSYETDSIKSYKKFRELLSKNFEKKFIELQY